LAILGFCEYIDSSAVSLLSTEQTETERNNMEQKGTKWNNNKRNNAQQ